MTLMNMEQATASKSFIILHSISAKCLSLSFFNDALLLQDSLLYQQL